MTIPEHRSLGVEQVPTGIAGLDTLLRGGLRRAGLHVVVGRPGTGKSVLAHQTGARIVRNGGRVLYLTALVETHQTLVSQARSFRFFDPSSVGHGFYYASLYPSLERGGLSAMRDEVGRLVREREPDLLILDGLHALKLAASSRLDYQRFVHELESMATVSGVATLFLTHPGGASMADPTYTIADGVIRLGTRPLRLRCVRTVRVAKLRGVDIVTGAHTFAITGDGIEVFPRLESIVKADPVRDYEETVTRHEFDVKGLTEMMGGGLPSSSITMVVGTPGSGKTLLGLAFLAGGVKEREPGLYFGFHDPQQRLLEKARAVGLDRLREGVDGGLVRLHHEPPVELLADQLAARILAEVDRRGVKRLVLDTVATLDRASDLGERKMEFLVALSDSLRRRGTATVFVHDVPRIAAPEFEIPLGEISPIVDGILHTRYTEIQAEFVRLIAVLKMRQQAYDRAIREFRIEKGGLQIGDRLTKGEGLITGVPRLADRDRS